MLNRGSLKPPMTAPKQYLDINSFARKRVKEERQRKHMTQEQLAESAGVSLDVIKRVESGMGTKCDALFYIAVGLNISIRALYPAQECDLEGRIADTCALLREALSK